MSSGDGWWWGWCLAGGVVLGLAWRGAAFVVDRAAEPTEAVIALDGARTLLTVVAGVIGAVALWRSPGAAPTRRLTVLLGGGLAAAILAWAVSTVLGGPPVRAPGVLLTWPMATAAGTFVIAAARVIGGPRAGHSASRSAPFAPG
jgi:hypothetical protein